MDKIQLNLFNDIPNKEVNNSKEINKELFWNYYLDFTSISQNINITPVEKRCLIFLMLNNYHTPFFNKSYAKPLQEYLRVSYNRVYSLKRVLMDKKLLTLNENKDVLLCNSLKYNKIAFDKILNDGQEIEFKFVFKIKE